MVLRDADIREPLFDFLEEAYGKTRILEEKRTGRSRADVVMVTEEAVIGLEIKSDADSYRRLAGQVKDYDRYYDYNFVVAGSRHALHIREHVPDYWGVITVEEIDGAVDFYVLRKPERNPKAKLKKKMSLLWRSELAALQQLYGMPKYTNKSKDFVISKIVERTEIQLGGKGYIELERLHREISDQLFERDYTQYASE